MKFLGTIIFAASLGVFAHAQESKPVAEAEKVSAPVSSEPVVRESSVTIAGAKIPYKVTSAKIPLKLDDGKTRASIFHVSYIRADVKDPATRPVMFAFNGGPGSSAVWLHLGVLGPKRVSIPGDGTQAPLPPAKVIENEFSILDVCDLVFIDPVSTGYSRAEKDTKPADFHGVDEDIKSVGDFIRIWITENNRWASPKYLLGESYGGIRAAGLSSHLQSRYGMSLNGVVLLSSLLDFATISPAQGNDLSYLTFLPSFTGAAHFHGKIQGDRDALIEESRQFAFGEYAAALLKGTGISSEERAKISERLASLTGLEAAIWSDRNLRIDPFVFRGELLKKEGKVIGRFDARAAWDVNDKSAAYAEYDPSYSLAYGAFSSAMLDYLGRDLGWKEDQPYEILTSKVMPWKWDSDNEVVNLSDKLALAMRDNPHLRVLIMSGHTDLATPPEGVAYSLRHLIDLPKSGRDRFEFVYYDAGHMFYLNPPDLTKTRDDLVKFIQAGNP